MKPCENSINVWILYVLESIQFFGYTKNRRDKDKFHVSSFLSLLVRFTNNRKFYSFMYI